MAVIVVLIGWLGKEWLGTRIEMSVTHEYDKKLETYKSELQQTTAAALRRMKTEYQNSMDRKATDKELFQQFLTTLPSTGSIEFIQSFNFSGFSFPYARLQDLQTFRYDWSNAEHEFLDSEMEQKRAKLLELVYKFLDYIATNTWPTEGNTDFSTVPPEWEYDDPDRFNKVVKIIHNLAQQIFELHVDLVRTGRKKFIVSMTACDSEERQ